MQRFQSPFQQMFSEKHTSNSRTKTGHRRRLWFPSMEILIVFLPWIFLSVTNKPKRKYTVRENAVDIVIVKLVGLRFPLPFLEVH